MYSSSIFRSIVDRYAGNEECIRSSRFSDASTRDLRGPAGARIEVVTADFLGRMRHDQVLEGIRTASINARPRR